ncbi:Receptor protein serine/threonine kinase [Aphelenchoides besseyi]|nr:Receptor protein serine/threonine kinase [Aphelenchoides besseyi]
MASGAYAKFIRFQAATCTQIPEINVSKNFDPSVVESTLLTQKQINHTNSILLHIIKTHQKHLEHPLVQNEVFCRCTVDFCDAELVHIGGESVRGICRARGGMCRQSVRVAHDGHVKSAALDCVPPEVLHPPDRPLVCETSKSSHSKDYILCCNHGSFCNDIDVPIRKPALLDKKPEGSNWPWFLVLLLIVAVIFSAIGLIFGIFWFNSDASKTLMQNMIRRFAGNDSAAFLMANSTLNRLLDDIEAQNNQEDAATAPYLARRTIARQIQLKTAIARGRYGDVWLGDWRGEKVAVKIFQSREEKSWQRETEIYSSNMLRHSNLLRWIASDNKDSGISTQLWLISEYMSNGSLYDYLENNTISITECVQFLRSIAHGLSYLHTEVPGLNSGCYKPMIAHRDIKTKNILVKNDMTCAIADLGMAARNLQGQLDVPDDGRGGTVRYLAPEYLNDTFMRERFFAYMHMDIYALSLVFWETTRRVKIDPDHSPPTFQVPYYEYVQREPTTEQMKEVVVNQKKRPSLSPEWSTNRATRELQRIMIECWTEHPASRLTSLNIRCSLDKMVEQEGLKIMT